MADTGSGHPNSYNARVESTPIYDYGKALSIDAEAIGQPGQRRFRLLALSIQGSACVWIEKEQLASVGQWLSEIITRLEEERPSDEPDVEPLPFPEEFDVDFRAGQLTLGYAEDEEAFVIQAFDFESDPERDVPTFRCMIGRGQSRVLVRKIEELVAAGRPICPFCQEPMEPSGHACPRANGHRKLTIRP